MDNYTVGTFQAPDGSCYHGTLRNGLPDGLGTCVWKDGSQYDGEWRSGQMNGFGTYVWKGGQRYDGEFKDGQRAGIGVKTYEDGSMYDGFWRNGKKHGLGVYRPAPEDHKRGWHPHHQHTSSGGPSLGDSKRVADGAEGGGNGGSQPATPQHVQLPRQLAHHRSAPDVLVGAREGQGGGLQSPLRDSVADLKLAELKHMEGGSAGPLSAPSISGQVGQGPLRLLIREYDEGRLLREDALSAEELKTIFGFLWPKKRRIRSRMRRVLRRREPRLQTKLGEVVYKGHYSYQLMLELQLGMRYCVGRALRPRGSSNPLASAHVGRYLSGSSAHSSGANVLPASSTKSAPPGAAAAAAAAAAAKAAAKAVGGVAGAPELVAADFREMVKISFPSCGSSTTPAHPSCDFKWKDYCPRVFRHLRRTFGIDDADYMLSLAGSQALRQLNSPGKSGSVFFLSEDERFLVKTTRKSEMDVLLNMLPRYVEHVTAHPHTLITRFFGLHRITPAGGRTVRFVVMANIFVTDVQIHRRYDIKGSTDGRTAGVDKASADPNVIFKDLDVDFKLVLEPKEHDKLMHQLRGDAELLQTCGVMDYSLLLGIHYPARAAYKVSLDNQLSTNFEGYTPGGLDYRITSDSEGERDECATAPSSARATATTRATSISDDATAGTGRSVTGTVTDAGGDGAFSPSAPTPGTLVTEGSGNFGAGLHGATARWSHGAERCTTDEVGGDKARNFDLHSGAAELDVRLAKIQKRMEKLGFSEQRKKDILELAKLKILGGKLKKSAARREPPSTVLAAIQQQRQDGPPIPGPEGGIGGPAAPLVGPLGLPLPVKHPQLSHLSSMKGAFAGLGVQEEEEDEETAALEAATQAYHRAQAQAQLGINMPALCIPDDPSERAEEVVICFGIIDILQDYSLRKVLERQVKSLSHDSGSISVAPPRKYGQRFLDFITKHIFASGSTRLGSPAVGGGAASLASAGSVTSTTMAAALAGAAALAPAAVAPAAGAPAAAAAAAAPAALMALPAAGPTSAEAMAAARSGDAPSAFDKPVSAFALEAVQLAAQQQVQVHMPPAQPLQQPGQQQEHQQPQEQQEVELKTKGGLLLPDLRGSNTGSPTAQNMISSVPACAH